MCIGCAGCLKTPARRPDRKSILSFLSDLAGAGAKANRDELKIMVGAMQGKGELIKQIPVPLLPFGEEFTRLSPAGGAIAIEAAKDLEQLLADIPDATLRSDWEYLARQIRHDLLIPPPQVLAKLNAMRQSLLKNWRRWTIFYRLAGVTSRGLAPRRWCDAIRGLSGNA